MITKKQYLLAEQFLFASVSYNALPLIHWRDDWGWIYFRTSDGEMHFYLSKKKELLDAIWNSVGLIRHAVKLVREARGER